MEKLIELLNEYTNHWPLCIRHSHNYEGIYAQVEEYFTVDITSKKFWFIQWLVENDKIDTDEFSTIDWFDDYESLLMRLAIDDEPIEFLASILK